MSDSPLVSVVIPSHDSAEYAERAVQWVLAPRFEDLEILLVDDGSAPAAAARREKRRSEASRLYRNGLASRWTARGLSGYLQSLAAGSGEPRR